MIRSSTGFTLVELMVAIMIFTFGLLAMAGTASLLMTMIAGSESGTMAAAVAESRFEVIRATACASRTSGSAVSRGISEAWTRIPLARADDVTVTVTFVRNRRVRTESFQSFIPC